MSKIGKISAIKRDYSSANSDSPEKSLAQRGMTRFPGTSEFKYPYKEIDGRYRTGLDEKAMYIKRIQDPVEQKVEIDRVIKLRKKLEDAIGNIDLSPKSDFWNYAKSTSVNDELHVQPVKLMDGDNLFDFSNPFQELNFAWLRVHPTIASSYQAWERGECLADTKFYVADEDIEVAVTFKKKQLINKAIAKFDSMTPEKRRRVARLLGLPVAESSKDDFVYNQVDNLLKQQEFKSGKFQGLSTVEVFNRFADMKENLLHIRDLIKQATIHGIYKIKPNGKIYEGENEIAKEEDELIKYLADEDHQDDLLTLEGKLKIKKIAAV